MIYITFADLNVGINLFIIAAEETDIKRTL